MMDIQLEYTRKNIPIVYFACERSTISPALDNKGNPLCAGESRALLSSNAPPCHRPHQIANLRPQVQLTMNGCEIFVLIIVRIA